jgi:Acetyltransferase (GNAT) domain
VAEAETGKIVGFLNAERLRRSLQIWQMAVHSNYQKQGIGRRLVDAAKQWSDCDKLTPVRMTRVRSDGWTDVRQQQFVQALSVTGSVDAATKMVRMSRKSAYQLRGRPDAASFAEAWDIAIETGRARVFDYLMERALNGVTTIRLKLGGAVEIGHGLDRHLVASHMKAPVAGENRFGRPTAPGQDHLR